MEHLSQSGDGCEIAGRCLDCPLRVCRFDMPSTEWRVRLRQVRDLDIGRRGATGESMADIAQAVGLSERSVWRAMAQNTEVFDFTDAEIKAMLPLVRNSQGPKGLVLPERIGDGE